MKLMIYIAIIIFALWLDPRLLLLVPILWYLTVPTPSVSVQSSEEVGQLLMQVFWASDWTYIDVISTSMYPNPQYPMNNKIKEVQERAEWSTEAMAHELTNWTEGWELIVAERLVVRELLKNNVYAKKVYKTNKRVAALLGMDVYNAIIDSDPTALSHLDSIAANRIFDVCPPIVRRLVTYFADQNKGFNYSLMLVLHAFHILTEAKEQTTNGQLYLNTRMRAHTEYHLDLWEKDIAFVERVKQEVSRGIFDQAFDMQAPQIRHLKNIARFYEMRRIDMRQLALDNLKVRKTETEALDLTKDMSDMYRSSYVY